MALHNPPLEIPFIDENGFVTEPWAKWLIIAKTDKANIVEGGTTNNILTLASDGNPQDGSNSISSITNLIDAPFSELSNTRIIAYSSDAGILQEIDLNDWITAGLRITVADDGDGTVTITADDQSIDAVDYISGTSNEITVIDDGDNTVTIEGAGSDTNFTAVTAIQAGGGGGVGFQYKTRALTLNGGIITTVGAESGWNDI